MEGTRSTKSKVYKDFYWHLSVYIVVNSGLAIVNLISSPDAIWFIRPVLGWGIGIIFHALSVFVFKDYLDTDNTPRTS